MLTTETTYLKLVEQLNIDSASLLPNWGRLYHEKGDFAFSNVCGVLRKESDLSHANSKSKIAQSKYFPNSNKKIYAWK